MGHMRRIVLRVLGVLPSAAVFGASLLIACGGELEGGGTPSPVAVSQLNATCNELFNAALAMANRCGSAPGTDLSQKAYHASHRANYIRACVAQASAPGYDVTRLDACLAEAKRTSRCVDYAELQATFPPNFVVAGPRYLYECLQRPGRLQEGEACAYDSQCASLRCTEGAPPKNGAPSYCRVCAGGGARTTQAYDIPPDPKQGDACSSYCAEGLACTRDKSTAGSESTCQPRSPEGAPCGLIYCQSGLTCKAGTCVKSPRGKLGDDCSFSQPINVQCEEDLACQAKDDGAKRECVPVLSRFSQLGEPCQADGKMGCDRMLWCDRGTCQPREASRCAL